MSIILMGVLLSQARVLPEIDRRALELQARAETLAATRPTPKQNATRRRAASAAPVRTAATRRPPAATRPPAAVRNAAVGGSMDLSAITTICRAAGSQADPAGFLATLSRAYAMAPDQSASLRASCAAYLAGRADARSSR